MADNGAGNGSIPEAFARANQPLALFERMDGKKTSVKLLCLDAAERWSESARQIVDLDLKQGGFASVLNHAIAAMDACKDLDECEPLYGAVQKVTEKIREVQAEKFRLIQTCLMEYDPHVFSQENQAQCTAVQLIAAFEKLRQYNDPFTVSTLLQQVELLELRKKIQLSGAAKI